MELITFVAAFSHEGLVLSKEDSPRGAMRNMAECHCTRLGVITEGQPSVRRGAF